MLTQYQKTYITKTLEYIKNYTDIHNKSYQIKNANNWFDKHNILSKDKLKKSKEA